RAELAARARGLARSDIRRRDDVAARRQMLEADERIGSADEAVAAPRQPRREELISEITRVVAIEQDGPRLWIGGAVAQRRERDAKFQRPAAIADPRRRFPEEIGRRVLARRIVGDGVVLNP